MNVISRKERFRSGVGVEGDLSVGQLPLLPPTFGQLFTLLNPLEARLANVVGVLKGFK